MSFRDPLFFLLLPVIAAGVYYIRKKQGFSSIRFSDIGLLGRPRPGIKILLANRLVYLWALALICFVTALARPQILLEEAKVQTEGVDIVLAIDSSGSMLAEDFKIANKRHNRLFVVKQVVEDFIRSRPGDRIGLVTFAGRAYTVCPLTSDHDWLVSNLNRVEIGVIEDGTSIGSGIMSSIGRLDKSKAKSKVIILLTDGENNAGNVSPVSAADAAKTFGIKIYTIGVGSVGPVPFPARNIWGETVYQNVNIGFDEALLRNIADITGAKYFMASDTESLRQIYRHIDMLEKTKIDQTGYNTYRELFNIFVLAGLFIIIAELVLSKTILRKIP